MQINDRELFEWHQLPLRISAIAGLGAIGDESDIAALKVIAQSKNFEKRAALAAIKKISNRRSVMR